jgi:acid stress-induced BolA-like protein IbaG/YrbA
VVRTPVQFLAGSKSLKIAPTMNPIEVAELIRNAIPGVTVDVRSDDNTHYSALVVSEAFSGLRALARHQLVYRALGERVGREIHALSIEAFTPAEWSARGSR